MQRSMIISVSLLLAAALCWGQESGIKTVETTVMDAPIVGKITTQKTTYVSKCRILEDRQIKFHNIFARIFSDDPSTRDITLMDLCSETVWEIDPEDQTYKEKSFADLRAEEQDDESNISIENDDDHPVIMQEVSDASEKVNGFKAHKVVTTIRSHEDDNPLVITEWHARKVPGMKKLERAYADLDQSLERGHDVFHGLPDFISTLYAEMEQEESLEQVPGIVIRAQILLLDDDGDSVFMMEYNLSSIREMELNEEVFQLPAGYHQIQ